jgi:hypothetical protein
LYVSILCCELKKKTMLTTDSITHKRRVWRYQRKVIRICKSKKNRQHNGQKKRDLTKPIKTKIVYLLFKYFAHISYTYIYDLMNLMLSQNNFNIYCIHVLNCANWFCISNLKSEINKKKISKINSTINHSVGFNPYYTNISPSCVTRSTKLS